MNTKILLVDDEERILHTFARTLRLGGYSVTTAEDGERGLMLYHQEQPDLVLLDLRMPGMDGLQVLQAIREDDPEANVILFTAHGDKDAVIEALRAGASDFLPKPIDQVTLESALRRAEERIHLKRKLRASQEALQQHNERLEEEVEARTAELQRSKSLLDATGRMARVGGWELDSETLEVRWTAETYRIHEVPLGQQPSLEEALDFFHPADRERLSQAIERALDEGEPYDLELRFITAKGKPLWTRTKCHPQVEGGKTVKLLGTFQDITDRKQAEEALRASHERLLTVLDSIDADIYVADMETYEVLFVNQHMRASFGEGLIGEICWQVFRGRSDPCPHCTSDQLLDPEGNPAGVVVWEGENPITGRWYINYDRAIRWVDDRLVRLQVATDITARKRAEEALHESEERYRNIVELAPDGILTMNLTGTVTSCNSAFLALTGYSREEIVGTHISKLPTLQVEDIPKYIRLALTALRGKLIEPVEFVWVHKDGTTRWGEAHVARMKRGSRIIGLQLILRDITGRKRTERLLEALNRAALTTKEAFTPEEVFTAVTEELEAMGISCALYLTDEDRTNLFPTYLTYDSAAIRAVERLVGVKREGFSIPIDRADVYREVVREKRTVFVEDTDELVRQLLPRPIKRFAPQIVKIVGIRQAIDAPLIVEDEVIGILAVQSNELTAEDVPTITAFAHEVAAAWHKAELLEQAQELTTKLKAIARPARQMSALLDLDELALQVVVSLQEITGCYNANLFLWEGDALVFAAGRGGYEDGGLSAGYRLPPDEGIIGHVAQTGEPVLAADVEQDPRYKVWDGLPNTRSELAMPLKRGDRVLGVMDMQSVEPDAFDATDLEALEVLANQLAVAIDNARLFEETQRLQRFNQGIVQSMAEGIVVEDAAGRITFVNPNTVELLGYTFEELKGQSWRAVVPAAQVTKVAQESARRAQGVASRYETALLTKDGREIPVIVSAQPLFEGERFTGVLSVFTDITERKELERALEERQRYLQGVLGAAPDAIVTMDADHRILKWNRGAERLFGYTKDEVAGQKLDQLVAEPDRAMLDQAMTFTQRAFDGQPVPPTETVRYRRDGTPVNVIMACAPIQIEEDLVGVVVVYTDITQWKQIEETLQESESRLRGILSSMTDHVFAFDREGRFTFFQPPDVGDLYLPPEEFIGRKHADVLPPHVSEYFAEAFERNKSGEPAEYEYCLEIGGETLWFSAKLSPRMVDGEFAGSVAVVRNVTQRKRVERALRESEERYRSILETIEDGYYEVDIAGNMQFFNPAMREILGYPADELMGMNHRDYMDDETARDVYQAFNSVYRTGEPTQAFDWEVIQKGGNRRGIEVSISLVRDSEGVPIGFRGISRDVTERQRMGQRLRERTAQLEALREIALSMSSQLALNELLHHIVERGCQLLDVGGGSLYLVDEETGNLKQVVSHGYKEDHTGTYIAPGEGIAGRVLQAGEPLTVDNYSDLEGRSPGWEDEDLTACLGVPLRRGEQIIGTLGFDEIAGPREFDAQDVWLAGLFANQAAIAIRNAQLFEETQRRALEQETLREAALAMTTALERDEVIEHILARLQEVVPYDTASVQLFRDGLLEIVGGRGFPNLDKLLGVTFDPSREDNPNREVVRTHAHFIVGDAPAAYEGFDSDPHAQAGVRSWLGVPMLVADRLIGMIALDKWEAGFYTGEHAQAAEAFAAQAAVAIENARLYQEVRRHAEELRGALDQLRELDRLKSEFIQNVSHELRSPLALIRGYAEMLDMGELGSLDPMQEEPVAIIARRSRMLSALVEDITLILGAEMSPSPPEPVPLGELARAAVVDFQISATGAELTLETEIASDLPPVRGTPTHLRRVLDNLLGNAVKFTPPQGTISVRVKQLQKDQVLLEVSDTGIGIPPDQRDRIFERFYQVDGSTKRRYPGTGLGLALVKEIVETYGGEVGVESEVGEGSTFAVTLPVFQLGDLQQEEADGT